MSFKQLNPQCIWFTGLPCSGKTTLARALAKHLQQLGIEVCVLDGDELRQGLHKDLTFSAEDRAENMRRTACVARAKLAEGMVVLVALISPSQRERENIRRTFGENQFCEIFVDASLSVCESRDLKGHYAAARKGQLKNFTGVDSIYEAPRSPDLHLNTDIDLVEQSVAKVLAFLSLP